MWGGEGGWVKATASLPRVTSCLVHWLAGTGALHHLLGLLLSHTALGYGLKEPEEEHQRMFRCKLCSCSETCQTANLLFNLRGTVHKVVAPELEGRILDQLNECDEEAPWVRPVHYQSLQQNPKKNEEEVLANQY